METRKTKEKHMIIGHKKHGMRVCASLLLRSDAIKKGFLTKNLYLFQ